MFCGFLTGWGLLFDDFKEGQARFAMTVFLLQRSLLGFVVGSTYGTDLQASYRQVAGLIMLFFGTFLWLVVVRRT